MGAFSHHLFYHSKGWGNRLRKSVCESLGSVTGSAKSDAVPSGLVKANPGAFQHADCATRGTDISSRVKEPFRAPSAKDLGKQGCFSSRISCGAVGASVHEAIVKGGADRRGQEEERHAIYECRPMAEHNKMMVKPVGTLGLSKDIGMMLSSRVLGIRRMSTSPEKQSDEGDDNEPRQPSLETGPSKPAGGSSWPNPDNAASYVLMSNIYADGDKWDEVKKINEMRLKARAWKKPGKAYVEIKAKVHEFIVGDRTHQEHVNIYEKLRKIKRHMNHIGYVPQVDLILENRSFFDPYKPR